MMTVVIHFTDPVSMTWLLNGMDVEVVINTIINHHQDGMLFVKSFFYGLITTERFCLAKVVLFRPTTLLE